MEVKYDDDDNDDDDDDDEAYMVRDKILLPIRINPKKLDLPDGQIFYVRDERVSRKYLPANVAIKKRGQLDREVDLNTKTQGAGILSSIFNLGTKLFKQRYLNKEFEIGSRVVNSGLGKKIT